MADDKDSGVSLDGVTSAAKWLVGAAGGLGAAAAAGLQLTDLNDASSKSGAIAAFVTAFLAVGIVLVTASKVLLPAYDSLADLVKFQRRIMNRVAESPPQSPGENPTEMTKLALKDRLFAHLQSGFSDTPSALLKAIRETTEATPLATLTATAKDMLATANAYRARARYQVMLGWLIVAGGLIVVAVPAFALTVAKPAQTSPPIDKAVSIIVHFVTRPIELAGASCSIENDFKAVAVGGSYAQPRIRVFAQNGCTGAAFTLSVDDSYVLAPQ